MRRSPVRIWPSAQGFRRNAPPVDPSSDPNGGARDDEALRRHRGQRREDAEPASTRSSPSTASPTSAGRRPRRSRSSSSITRSARRPGRRAGGTTGRPVPRTAGGGVTSSTRSRRSVRSSAFASLLPGRRTTTSGSGSCACSGGCSRARRTGRESGGVLRDHQAGRRARRVGSQLARRWVERRRVSDRFSRPRRYRLRSENVISR